MAPWDTLKTRWYGHISRRKPAPMTPSLVVVPMILAATTTVLLVYYVSITWNNSNSSTTMTTSHDYSSFRTFVRPSMGKRRSYMENEHGFIAPPARFQPNRVIETSAGRGLEPGSRGRGGLNRDFDKLLVDDSGGSPHLDVGSATSGSSQNDDVYHDKETFLGNYEEMKRSLKIYIYPHKENDPFALAFLPSYKNEPGGNYASEAYFKNNLFRSHFITNDSSMADLFFLPFSIASLRHDPRIGVDGLKDFIKNYMDSIRLYYPYWNASGGVDHFYVACHSVGKIAMDKVEYVKNNAIQVVCSSSYFIPTYFAHKDVCLPQIWPRHEHLLDLGPTKRKTLAFFAGAVNSPVRKTLIQAWENDSSIFAHSGRLKTPYSEPLLNSKYCLHVKGFEVNTARIGDAIYYGCVPVILADYYDLPFMDILNWSSFSVVVPISDIPNLKKILNKISNKEYLVLQANVLKVRKHFQWNKSPLDFDAFYMVMYELWLRRSSIRVFS